MGGGEVTARNLALGLAAISPLTGPAAPIVAGAALGLGLGILMALAITAVQERYGTEGVQGAVDLQGLYATVTNQPGVGVELANAGYEALFLQSRLLRDFLHLREETLGDAPCAGVDLGTGQHYCERHI